MGLEPTTFGTTIRHSNRLSYIHRFDRKAGTSRIVPAEIDSVGSAGSCTRRNPTLFSRNARRRFE